MPSLEFFVVANSIAVDQRSNRLSIFEVIEDLAPIHFPAHLPRLAAITIWTLEQADQGQDFQATLRISGPEIPEPAEFRQNFTGDGDTQRMLFQLLNIPILGQGTMVFEMLLNGERRASHQVRIAAADAAASNDGFLIYRMDDQQAPPAERPAEEPDPR